MSRKRVESWVMWGLAVVVPGGLVLLALWLSVRAARRQAMLAPSAAPRVSHPSVAQS